MLYREKTPPSRDRAVDPYPFTAPLGAMDWAELAEQRVLLAEVRLSAPKGSRRRRLLEGLETLINAIRDAGWDDGRPVVWVASEDDFEEGRP